MTCRVCKHWKGDVGQWNEDGQLKVVGPCWRNPTPVETASTYSCEGLLVDPKDARHWLHMWCLERAYYKRTKDTLEKTEATLERVRARVRSLKEKS